MTEEQKKEMLNGIINNGEKWEYRWCTAYGWSNWKDYKLGDEIHDGYEYRKVENWVVFQWYKSGKYHLDCTENLNDNYDYIIVFEGTKEDCEKWIEEHPKQRMTNRQLAEWLAKGNGERSHKGLDGTCTTNLYTKGEDYDEVPNDYVIRAWGSEEWIEPTVDIYERDCKGGKK